MKKIMGVLGLIVVLLAAWLGFAPVPIEARAWQAPEDAGYVGPFAPNTRLAGLQTIALGADVGPEHVAIGPDGRLYAAVASGAILRMGPDGSGLEVFARTGGRVLRFDFDAAGNLVADDANDVSAKAVAAGGDPRARVLMSNLPGYPDKLMRGAAGRLWLGFAKPRAKAVDEMADKPYLRELTLRLPRALWPVPPAYGHVIAFDEDGRVLLDLQDATGSYPETTGVTETPERLYIHSLHAKALGWMPRPEAIR